MTNNEFKQGDRVRSKVAIYAIPAGRTGVITAIMRDGRYKVRLDGEVEWHGWYEGKDLELIESFDRRTAFLTRLQSLLREFDAKICGGLEDISEKDVVFILIGDNDKVKYLNGDSHTYAHINADNIMDFEKE